MMVIAFLHFVLTCSTQTYKVNSVVTKYWHNDWMNRPLVKYLALQFWNTKLPYAKSLFCSCYDWCMQNTWQVNGFVYCTMVLFTGMMCECSQSFQLQCHLCAVNSWSVQSPHLGMIRTCMKVCETPYKPCIFSLQQQIKSSGHSYSINSYIAEWELARFITIMLLWSHVNKSFTISLQQKLRKKNIMHVPKTHNCIINHKCTQESVF